MMRRENGRVVLDISEEEYGMLLFAVGLATSSTNCVEHRAGVIRLTNALNQGNPAWTPIDVDACIAGMPKTTSALNITLEDIAAYLESRGWKNERPGSFFAWRDPAEGISGYCWSEALEIQLDRAKVQVT
jgi:hypothetical protein